MPLYDCRFGLKFTALNQSHFGMLHAANGTGPAALIYLDRLTRFAGFEMPSAVRRLKGQLVVGNELFVADKNCGGQVVSGLLELPAAPPAAYVARFMLKKSCSSNGWSRPLDADELVNAMGPAQSQTTQHDRAPTTTAACATTPAVTSATNALVVNPPISAFPHWILIMENARFKDMCVTVSVVPGPGTSESTFSLFNDGMAVLVRAWHTAVFEIGSNPLLEDTEVHSTWHCANTTEGKGANGEPIPLWNPAVTDATKPECVIRFRLKAPGHFKCKHDVDVNHPSLQGAHPDEEEQQAARVLGPNDAPE